MFLASFFRLAFIFLIFPLPSHALRYETLFPQIRIDSQDYTRTTDESSSKESVIHNPSLVWLPIPDKGFSKPYDNSSYWLRFRIHVQVPGIYYLMNEYSLLEHAEVFVVDSTATIESYGDKGLRTNMSSNDYPFPIFKLIMDKGCYDVYFYQKKRFSTSAQKISILNVDEFNAHMHSYQFSNGLIYALFLFLLIQSFIGFFVLKSGKYLFYSGYLLTLFVILAVSEGSYKLIFPTYLHSTIYFLMYYAIVLCFYFLFLLFSNLVPVRWHYPSFRKFNNVVFGVFLSIVGIHHYIFENVPTYPSYLFKFSNLSFSILPISFLLISIYFYFKFKYRAAFWLLLIFSFPFIFVVFFSILPFLEFEHLLFIQLKWLIVVEAFVMFIFLFNDFKIISNERTQFKQTLREERLSAAVKFLTGMAQERQFMFSQLHDDLSLKLTLFERNLESASKSNLFNSKALLNQFSSLKDDVRLLTHNLYSFDLEKYGLVEAIHSKIQQIEDQFPDLVLLPDLSIPSIHLDKNVEVLLFLTFSELMQNALKYSLATEIKVQLLVKNEYVILIVEDNGIGFDTTADFSGLGLKNIQRRAEMLIGFFKVESIPCGGTRNVLKIPVFPLNL